MGLYKNFRLAMGIIHQGDYTRKCFLMHCYAQNAAPWALRGQKRKIAKKISFFICSRKWRLYTGRGGGRGLEGVIHQIKHQGMEHTSRLGLYSWKIIIFIFIFIIFLFRGIFNQSIYPFIVRL